MNNSSNSIRDIDLEDFYKNKNSKDKIIFILKFGTLAPSTHNSQPWLFKIQNNTCEIYSNSSIVLNEADPTGRDLFISFGCLIENIDIASKFYNVTCNIEYVLDQKRKLVARITFDELNKSKSPQLEFKSRLLAIIKRQTVRGIFENKKVPVSIFESLKKKNSDIHVDFIIDSFKIEKLSSLTAEGLRIAYRNGNFRKEMAHWFRVNSSLKKDGLPGYALKMPTLLSYIFPTLVRYFNIGNLVSTKNYLSMSSAKLVCVLSSKINNQKTWLEVGRQAQHMMLVLHSKNIMTSIYIAAIEMGDLSRSVQKLIGKNLTPQFIFCAGYMNKYQKYTPRLSVYEKIID